jgi:hypothetical protein
MSKRKRKFDVMENDDSHNDSEMSEMSNDHVMIPVGDTKRNTGDRKNTTHAGKSQAQKETTVVTKATLISCGEVIPTTLHHGYSFHTIQTVAKFSQSRNYNVAVPHKLWLKQKINTLSIINHEEKNMKVIRELEKMMSSLCSGSHRCALDALNNMLKGRDEKWGKFPVI